MIEFEDNENGEEFWLWIEKNSELFTNLLNIFFMFFS
jgi:hypothetical protein